MNDTIAAISTAIGQGAIGIVRMSGPVAFDIAGIVFKPTNKAAPPFIPNKIYHGHIIEPSSNMIVDEVLVSFMIGPKSYTTENVVEINSHSNHLVMEKILSILIKQGARLAEPGEFTFRAFMGGRIDLTQAEAVSDIIRAKSTKALEIGQRQLKGRLGEIIRFVYEEILDILKELEVTIDFPDNTDDISRNDLAERLERNCILPLQELINDYKDGLIFKNGVRVAIIGKTNVGKSSLINVLTKNDTAIVSDIHGTTRDSISCGIYMRGLPITITDTAGIRKTADPLESIGVEKSISILKDAHIVVVLTDVFDPDLPKEILSLIGPHQEWSWAINKVDLLEKNEKKRLSDKYKNAYLIAAKRNFGIDMLKEHISDKILKNALSDHEVLCAPNERHKKCLDLANEHLRSAKKKLIEIDPEEIIAIELKSAAEELQNILGARADVDLIKKIFDDFCVGK
jgi:tRNA modification GTPase